MDTKKTQRLYKLQFDPHDPNGFYNRPGSAGEQMRNWLSNDPPSLLFRAWHWHIKGWVEPWYPNRLPRKLSRFWQRRTKGFDDTELWGLDYSLAKLIYPRLKAFHQGLLDEKIHGYPPDLHPCWPNSGYDCPLKHDHNSDVGYTKWQEIVGVMLYPFETIILEEEDPDYDAWFMTSQAHVNRGMELFCKYFRSLWD